MHYSKRKLAGHATLTTIPSHAASPTNPIPRRPGTATAHGWTASSSSPDAAAAGSSSRRPVRRRPSARTRSTTTLPSRSVAAAITAFADAAASSADAAALVASDLADFVRSDADEVPRSVKQLAKLAASPEVSATVSTLSEAVTSGILPGAGSPSSGPASGGAVALSDRLVDRLFSDSGERLASAVAGSFARHLVLAFYSAPSPHGEASSSPTMWVNVVASGKCRKAISNWVEVFVGTAVREFIDKTIHINTYEQLFEGLTNPRHDAKVKELLVSVCNAAVETLVKTTHHALYNTNGNLDANGSVSGNANGAGEGWVETVSSTLAVPSNRKFVLDVTGRVTFETVRSFLEFVLWKLQDGARKGGGSVVDSGLRVVRYMSDKSMVIATICITLCLHVLNGTRLLVTA